ALALAAAPAGDTLAARNEALFRQMQQALGLDDATMARIRAIFARSGYVGQGNPAITQHPATPQECEARAEKAGVHFANPEFERICGARYMAPLYDPARQ